MMDVRVKCSLLNIINSDTHKNYCIADASNEYLLVQTQD